MTKVYKLNKKQRSDLAVQKELQMEQDKKTHIQSVPSLIPIQMELHFGGVPVSNNPKTIDVVCTATKRPVIIEQTFKSFSEKFFKKYPTRLIMNIDPVGINCSSEKIINIGKKYFDEVYTNTPSKPDFFKAFKWIFTNCTSKYVFHLQDDWLLLKDHDINEFIGYLDSNPILACVRMPFKARCEGKMMNSKVMIGTKYYDHPALWKREFYDEIMKYFDTDYGTEFQIKGRCPVNSDNMLRICNKWLFGVYYDGSNSITDIGRDWLGVNGFSHKHNKPEREGGYLTSWTKH